MLHNTQLYFTAQPGVDSLLTLVALAESNDAQAIMVFSADHDLSAAELDRINHWLRSSTLPIGGGIFPQIIFDQFNHSQGHLVFCINSPLRILNLPGLSDTQADHANRIRAVLPQRPSSIGVMVLVDGLSGGISHFLDCLYDVVGVATPYFGGGAGSLSFIQKPCIYSNQGLLTDHAQLVCLPGEFSIGVEHGWEQLMGPFVANDTHKNVIHELDYQPAFALYKRHVEADSGQRLSADNFFDIAKGYPFGLVRPDGSIIVRDPIRLEGNDLICVGELPLNSVVHILKGHPSQLIEAVARGVSQLPTYDSPILWFNCISRSLFLGQRFGDELHAAQGSAPHRTIFGAMTLGEIANEGTHCLEFYNKTAVFVGEGRR